MLQKIAVISFFLLIYNGLFSQNIKKAYQLMAENQLNEAEEIFDKAVGKRNKLIEAKFGLSLLHSNSDFEDYDLAVAYRNINYVQRHFKRLKKRKKQKYSEDFYIDAKRIMEVRSRIVNTAFQSAMENRNIEVWNDFIATYEDEKQAGRAIQIRDSLAYSIACATDTYKSYDWFVRNFPEAEQVSHAKKLYQTRSREFYEQYIADGELGTINDFENEFPYFNYPETVNKSEDKRWAKVAKNLSLEKGLPKKPKDKYELEEIKKDYKIYIKNAAPNELAFVALQRLIEPALRNHQWNEAAEIVDEFAPYFDYQERIKTLKKMLTEDCNIQIFSIKGDINTKGSEYAPVITADGNRFYFCGIKRPDNLGYEDIFVAENKNDSWTNVKLISGLNTKEGFEAPLSISADGNTMFLFSNSDIYKSQKNKTGWSEKMPVNEINTKEWEADAMITSDGKSIIFVSDRKGNVGKYHKLNDLYHGSYGGNTDIYIIHKTKNGWSEPQNLGSSINTPFSERSPFLHPDMKTMYFSSDGHGGFGRLDIYKTERLSDTSWTHWSKPVNLGKMVNTPDDDWGYKISTNGKTAFFSAYNGKDYDIYQFELPETMRPQKLVTINGIITDIENKPIDVSIVWEDLETGEPVGTARIDPITGRFFVALPLGKNYGYYIAGDSIFPHSNNIDLRKKNESLNIVEDIRVFTIDEMKRNEITIPLRNLFFDFNKFTIKPESYTELNRLAGLIKQYNLQVRISGHTDNTGTDEHNQELSDNRAEAVKDYLVEKGCAEKLITTVGYGAEKPIADNETEEGRAKNRRVEIKFIKK